MSTQTTTIEAVSIVRPLKIVALICLFVAFILLIVCISTTWWLRSGSFRIGLFLECASNEKNAPTIIGGPPPGKCQRPLHYSTYIKVIAAFLITSAALILFAFILNLIGIRSRNLHKKYFIFKIVTYLAMLSLILKLASLIIFPVCFYVEMKNFGYRNWEFDWSYGVAWGATLFTFDAVLLLICDKEHEDIYYKKKTIYNPPPELK